MMIDLIIAALIFAVALGNVCNRQCVPDSGCILCVPGSCVNKSCRAKCQAMVRQRCCEK